MAKVDTDAAYSEREQLLTGVIRRCARIQEAACELLMHGDTTIHSYDNVVDNKAHFRKVTEHMDRLLEQVRKELC